MEMMKEITKQGEEADKRFHKFEEKRMNLEAKLEEQRRKREDDHALRMQHVYEVITTDDVCSCRIFPTSIYPTIQWTHAILQ